MSTSFKSSGVQKKGNKGHTVDSVEQQVIRLEIQSQNPLPTESYWQHACIYENLIYV